VVDPVDATISIFYSSAGLRVVLHDLTGTDFPMDIDLPEYHFLICRGTQQVVVGCLGNLKIGKIFAEEPDKVRVVGEGAFQVFARNIIRSFGLGGLRCKKECTGIRVMV
jgi:hypothetical protein